MRLFVGGCKGCWQCISQAFKFSLASSQKTSVKRLKPKSSPGGPLALALGLELALEVELRVSPELELAFELELALEEALEVALDFDGALEEALELALDFDFALEALELALDSAFALEEDSDVSELEDAEASYFSSFGRTSAFNSAFRRAFFLGGTSSTSWSWRSHSSSACATNANRLVLCRYRPCFS